MLTDLKFDTTLNLATSFYYLNMRQKKSKKATAIGKIKTRPSDQSQNKKFVNIPEYHANIYRKNQIKSHLLSIYSTVKRIFLHRGKTKHTTINDTTQI